MENLLVAYGKFMAWHLQGSRPSDIFPCIAYNMLTVLILIIKIRSIRTILTLVWLFYYLVYYISRIYKIEKNRVKKRDSNITVFMFSFYLLFNLIFNLGAIYQFTIGHLLFANFTYLLLILSITAFNREANRSVPMQMA